MSEFNRTKLLIGEDSFNVLQSSSVALFGVGGVGGFVAEALVRSGIGSITIFENDAVSLSNVNRQIIATAENVGKNKTDVIKERLLSINKNLKITCNNVFYLPENADEYDLSKYDYVVDAVDTVTAKLEIIKRARLTNVPVISCMGTGGKTDPTQLKVSFIENTSGCPLARVMRRELKKLGIERVKAVFSAEQSTMDDSFLEYAEKKNGGRIAPPSMIFAPATAGLILAREVVFDLIERNKK